MDLREIIKWFIPCFHLLFAKLVKMDAKLMMFCFLVLFFNSCVLTANVDVSVGLSETNINSFNATKNIDNLTNDDLRSENGFGNKPDSEVRERIMAGDSSVGRTFGRPFKKMAAALIPLVFQIGAASTWAVVAAIVGFKTLLVTLLILKLIIIAGAAKLGALFASKGHGHGGHVAHGGWEQPPLQKEIHLHIHNGRDHEPEHAHEHHHEEHYPISSWSRESYPQAETKSYFDPYRAGPTISGPTINGPTISTPFGSYVKVDAAAAAST